MRTSSSTLIDALAGDFDVRLVADVVLDGNRLFQDIPITSPSFADDGTSLVQSTGSVTVVYQGDFADSIAPKAVGDALSPFGTQLWIYALVTVGDGFQERVTMGHYLISETPSIVSERWLFNGGVVSRGDRIDVQLKDILYGIQRDRFDIPGAPPSLTSVWSEIQRLAQLPVTRSITDAAIPATVAYQEDKLQAIYDLANVLDAVVYATPDGTIGMRPNVWPAAVATLAAGDGGTLISIARAMANDSVYNKVVVRTNAADGTAVLAVAEQTSGPLRTANADGSLSPYRRVPYFYSSDYVTTQAQGVATAATLLPRVSRLRSVTVALTETYNPLREVGDVITVNRVGETFTGRVSKISRPGTQTQTTTVVVNP